MKELSFLLLFAGIAATNAISCSKHYRRDEVTGVRFNYCWKFVNHNLTVKAAETVCKRMNGILPAVNTADKANKLAAFIRKSRQLYVDGKNGDAYKEVYDNGWKGDDFLVSPIYKGENKNYMVWRSTKYPVTFKELCGKPDTRSGYHCTVFNYETAKWRFVPCGMARYPVVCEERIRDFHNKATDNVTKLGQEEEEEGDVDHMAKSHTLPVALGHDLSLPPHMYHALNNPPTINTIHNNHNQHHHHHHHHHHTSPLTRPASQTSRPSSIKATPSTSKHTTINVTPSVNTSTAHTSTPANPVTHKHNNQKNTRPVTHKHNHQKNTRPVTHKHNHTRPVTHKHNHQKNTRPVTHKHNHHINTQNNHIGHKLHTPGQKHAKHNHHLSELAAQVNKDLPSTIEHQAIAHPVSGIHNHQTPSHSKKVHKVNKTDSKHTHRMSELQNTEYPPTIFASSAHHHHTTTDMEFSTTSATPTPHSSSILVNPLPSTSMESPIMDKTRNKNHHNQGELKAACARGYTLFKSRCFRYTKNRHSVRHAGNVCKRHGGHVAKILTNREWKAVSSFVRAYPVPDTKDGILILNSHVLNKKSFRRRVGEVLADVSRHRSWFVHLKKAMKHNLDVFFTPEGRLDTCKPGYCDLVGLCERSPVYHNDSYGN